MKINPLPPYLVFIYNHRWALPAVQNPKISRAWGVKRTLGWAFRGARSVYPMHKSADLSARAFSLSFSPRSGILPPPSSARAFKSLSFNIYSAYSKLPLPASTKKWGLKKSPHHGYYSLWINSYGSVFTFTSQLTLWVAVLTSLKVAVAVNV